MFKSCNYYSILRLSKSCLTGIFVFLAFFFATTANAQQIITGNPGDYGFETGSAPGSVFPSTSPSNNNVTVSNNVSKNVYGGIGNSGISVNGNKTNITNGKVSGVIYGGWSKDSDTSSNSVTISNASADGDNSTVIDNDSNDNATPSTINTIYGAYIDGGTGSAENNSIIINSGASVRSMYGAYSSGTGALTGNSITINGGTIGASITGVMIISGAYAGIGNSGTLVSNNSLTINGGTVFGTDMSLYGARGATTARLDNNSVSVTGGIINVAGIYGGQNVNGQGTVVKNHVDISGGTVTATEGIFGGYSDLHVGDSSAVVNGNGVTVSGNATVIGNIYGGYTHVKNAISNYVIINGGHVEGNIYGAYNSSDNDTGDYGIFENVVTVSGGTIDGNLYGAYSDKWAVTGNEVNVSGGTVNHDIYGGHSGGANVYINWVTISGGAVKGNIYGGHSPTGLAQYNEVRLNGGTITGNVYGGYSDNDDATQNTVTISGGTVTGNVYGGYSGSGNADDNSVYLSGSTVTGTVYGSSVASSSGNTLIASSGSSSVGGIQEFESVDAYSGATIRVTGNTTNAFNDLTNDGWITFVNGVTNQGIATVAGNYSGSGHLGLDVLLSENAGAGDADSIIFDHTPTDPVDFYFKALPESVANPYDPETIIAQVTDGGTLTFTTVEQGFGIYSYDIQQDSTGNILLGLKADNTDQTTRPYPAARVAGLASLSFAFDNFLRSSLQKAVSETEGRGFGVFISGAASKERINAGSDVDLNTMSSLLTLAYHKYGSPIAVGGYAEFLYSSYKTHNKVYTNLGEFNVKSRGSFNNISTGVFLQYREHLSEIYGDKNFSSWLPGAHIEVSARVGGSDMEFETVSINPAKFDDNGVAYAGASLSGGYVFKIPKIAIDLYGYGMYIRKSANDVTDNLNQRIEFEKAETLRFVSGVRVGYTALDFIRPYIGIAADYETMNNPKVTIDGYAADQSDFSGLSGMFELGVNARSNAALVVDFKMMASVGKHAGIGGLFEMKYGF